LVKCKVCNKEFTTNNKYKYCLDCKEEAYKEVKKIANENYRKNYPEKTREGYQNWLIKNKDKKGEYQKEYIKEWKKKNNIKVNAGQLARTHIKISQNQLCQKCNENVALQRHHPDYSKPLMVELLCLNCHQEVTQFGQ
jgi:hypothetical protein